MTRVGEARDGEGHASRHIRFDDSGDHVHRWPLCCDDEVVPTALAFAHSGNRLFNVACRNHHEVVQLVDDDDDVRHMFVLGCITPRRHLQRSLMTAVL